MNMVVASVNAFSQILKIAAELPMRMAAAMAGGGFNLGDFLRDSLTSAAAAMTGTKLTWKGVNIPALDALEEQLRKEFEDKKGTLNQSWEEFKRQKLEEFAKQNPGVDPEQKGEEDGKKYGQGMSKGLKGTEAVLFRSAEALSRRFEQLERMREGRDLNNKGGGAGGSVSGANLNLRQQEQQTDLLKKINENTKASANKDGAAVLPANL